MADSLEGTVLLFPFGSQMLARLLDVSVLMGFAEGVSLYCD